MKLNLPMKHSERTLPLTLNQVKLGRIMFLTLKTAFPAVQKISIMIKAAGLETEADQASKNMYCRVGFSEAI